MVKVPSLQDFKKDIEVVGHDANGNECYDTVYRKKMGKLEFIIEHQEEEYGNDTHGWNSRIEDKNNYERYDCGIKEISVKDAYNKFSKIIENLNIHTHSSKKEDELQEKIKKLDEKIITYQNKHSIKNLQSEFIGCKNCNSRLARRLLISEDCPVCHNDLRNKTTVETLRKYAEKRKKLSKELFDIRKK